MDASKRGTIIVVDDEQEMCALLQDFLQGEGYRVHAFPSALDALTQLRPGGKLQADGGEEIDVIISDLKMAGVDGMEFLKRLTAERPEVPVILATAFGSIDTAIEAMRNGAYHYIVKPFKLTEVTVTIEHAIERRSLSRENTVLRQEIEKNWKVGHILGKSTCMKAIFDLVGRVSQSSSNVLITGESGTGKEVVARAIHQSGPRTNMPFVAINCAAIPEALLESELFGHAKGSFTGAIVRKRGLFDEANGGTLFLDEIGDMSPQLQVKLLRVLQDKQIRAVGDNTYTEIDVRVIAATHKDLKAAIREKKFREDLYYRLSVIPISIPPLRERREDIPLLADYFLHKSVGTIINNGGKRIRGFSRAAIAKLMEGRWDGNVRELENVIERAVVLCTQEFIDVGDLPDPDAGSPEQVFAGLTGDLPTIADMEMRYIRLVLHHTGGRKDKAANILGINRRTLYRKEHEYGWAADTSEGGGEDAHQ